MKRDRSVQQSAEIRHSMKRPLLAEDIDPKAKLPVRARCTTTEKGQTWCTWDVSRKSLVVHAIDERKRVVWRGEVAATASGLQRALREIGAAANLPVF